MVSSPMAPPPVAGAERADMQGAGSDRAGPRTGLLIALVAGLCLLPLFVTPVLPLIDFYAHVVRYEVLANLAQDPGLAENYRAAWRPLPNLGLDILGTGLMDLVPPLPGAKLIGAMVILAPYFGVLALARSLGRVGPVNIALAGILSYSMILGWGFANFLLGLGLAFGTIGFWIAARDRPVVQFGVTAALALLIMLVHGLVFGLWGLMLFAVEVMLLREGGLSGGGGGMPRPGQAARSLLRLAGLAVLPVILFLQTKTVDAAGGVTGAFANLAAHAEQGGLVLRLVEEIRDRSDSFLRVAESTWPWADRAFGLVLWGALAAGYLSGVLRLDRRLWLAAAIAAVFVGVMPPNLFDVGHLDERMPLLLLGLIAAGTRVQPSGQTAQGSGRLGSGVQGSGGQGSGGLGSGGLGSGGLGSGGRGPAVRGSGAGGGPAGWVVRGLWGLFALHLAMVTAGWAQEGASYRKYLEGLALLEPGGLGETVFLGDTQARDPGRSCKPLLFLMLLRNGTAVTTFANPTQQPLALQGPLVAAQARAKALRPVPAAGAAPEPRAVRVGRLIDAGFRSVVTCDGEPPLTDLPQAELIAADGKWALYQLRPAAPGAAQGKTAP